MNDIALRREIATLKARIDEVERELAVLALSGALEKEQPHSPEDIEVLWAQTLLETGGSR